MPTQKISLRTGDTLPLQTRSFEFKREALDEESRTIDVTFSTETESVERWFGIEKLDHSPGACDLTRLNANGPFLMDHDFKDQRGAIESATIEGDKGRATIRFSRGERGNELMQDIKDGIRTSISVGYLAHEVVLERQSDTEPDVYLVTKWEPYEISSVSVPADIGAQVDRGLARSGDSPTSQISIRNLSQTPPPKMKPPKKQDWQNAARALFEGDAKADFADYSDDEQTQLRGWIDEQEKEPTKEPETKEPETRSLPATPAAPVAPAPAGLSADDMKRAIAADRERIRSIESISEKFGVEAGKRSAAIDGDTSVEAFRLAVMADLEKRNAPFSTPHVSDGPAPVAAPTTAAGRREADHEAFTENVRSLNIKGINIQTSSRRSFPSLNEDPDAWREQRGLQRAAEFPTLLDIASLDAGRGSSIIDETIASSPELSIFPSTTQVGAEVKLSVLNTLPTVGFRNANEGSAGTAPKWDTKLFETMLIEREIPVDLRGVLEASGDPARVLSAHTSPYMKAAMEHIAVNGWYGATKQSGADAKAPPGFYSQFSDDAAHTVDAEGSSAKTSVWFFELGEDKVDFRWGNNSTLQMGDWMEDWREDASSNRYKALVNELFGRVAPRIVNKNCAVRIKNIDAGSNSLTEELLYDAHKLAEDLGMTPNAIFMTTRSRKDYRSELTATTISGRPAPLPRDFEGIPIYTTRNISNAETV